MPVGRWQRDLSTYPVKQYKPEITESPGQDRNTHIDNEETEKCQSMAAVMLFLLGKDRKTEHNTHFCMPLKPVFTRDCGSGVHFTDEPTGALNKANSEEVMNLLTELNHDGQSILMVTHDVRAAIHGNRILYLEDGKILDELNLPPYGNDELKARENNVLGWLSSLGW